MVGHESINAPVGGWCWKEGGSNLLPQLTHGPCKLWNALLGWLRANDVLHLEQGKHETRIRSKECTWAGLLFLSFFLFELRSSSVLDREGRLSSGARVEPPLLAGLDRAFSTGPGPKRKATESQHNNSPSNSFRTSRALPNPCE